MHECCRQVEAEVVSNSRNKIHQTWGPPFSQALYVQICVKDEDEPTGQSLSAARKDLAAAIRDAGERTGFCYITSFDSILPASMLKVQIE